MKDYICYNDTHQFKVKFEFFSKHKKNNKCLEELLKFFKSGKITWVENHFKWLIFLETNIKDVAKDLNDFEVIVRKHNASMQIMKRA